LQAQLFSSHCKFSFLAWISFLLQCFENVVVEFQLLRQPVVGDVQQTYRKSKIYAKQSITKFIEDNSKLQKQQD
jgi:hypothetical protein